MRDDQLTAPLVEHHVATPTTCTSSTSAARSRVQLVRDPARDPGVIEAYLGGELEEVSQTAPLELEDVTAAPPAGGQALHGVSLTVDEGEIAEDGARSERSQDDDAPRDLRHREERDGEVEFAGSKLGAPAPTRSPAWIAHVPEGRGTLLRAHRLGEPAARRLHASRPAKDDFARMRVAPPVAPGAAKRRPTLSGGEQQMRAIARGRDAAPAAADARRAVARPRADARDEMFAASRR